MSYSNPDDFTILDCSCCRWGNHLISNTFPLIHTCGFCSSAPKFIKATVNSTSQVMQHNLTGRGLCTWDSPSVPQPCTPGFNCRWALTLQGPQWELRIHRQLYPGSDANSDDWICLAANFKCVGVTNTWAQTVAFCFVTTNVTLEPAFSL